MKRLIIVLALLSSMVQPSTRSLTKTSVARTPFVIRLFNGSLAVRKISIAIRFSPLAFLRPFSQSIRFFATNAYNRISSHAEAPSVEKTEQAFQEFAKKYPRTHAFSYLTGKIIQQLPHLDYPLTQEKLRLLTDEVAQEIELIPYNTLMRGWLAPNLPQECWKNSETLESRLKPLYRSMGRYVLSHELGKEAPEEIILTTVSSLPLKEEKEINHYFQKPTSFLGYLVRQAEEKHFKEIVHARLHCPQPLPETTRKALGIVYNFIAHK